MRSPSAHSHLQRLRPCAAGPGSEPAATLHLGACGAAAHATAQLQRISSEIRWRSVSKLGAAMYGSKCVCLPCAAPSCGGWRASAMVQRRSCCNCIRFIIVGAGFMPCVIALHRGRPTDSNPVSNSRGVPLGTGPAHTFTCIAVLRINVPPCNKTCWAVQHAIQAARTHLDIPRGMVLQVCTQVGALCKGGWDGVDVCETLLPSFLPGPLQLELPRNQSPQFGGVLDAQPVTKQSSAEVVGGHWTAKYNRLYILFVYTPLFTHTHIQHQWTPCTHTD